MRLNGRGIGQGRICPFARHSKTLKLGCSSSLSQNSAFGSADVDPLVGAGVRQQSRQQLKRVKKEKDILMPGAAVVRVAGRYMQCADAQSLSLAWARLRQELHRAGARAGVRVSQGDQSTVA